MMIGHGVASIVSEMDCDDLRWIRRRRYRYVYRYNIEVYDILPNSNFIANPILLCSILNVVQFGDVYRYPMSPPKAEIDGKRN